MLKRVFAVRSVIGLSLGLAVLLSAPASADAKGTDSAASKEKKKVLVGGFEGPKSAQARKSVISALKDDGGYDVIESTDIKPGADDKSYASASAGASAVLVGVVKKSGLVLSVRNGADGALVQDIELKADSPAKLSKAIDDTLGLSVSDAISQTKPATADEASPAAEEGAPAAEEEAPAAEATPSESEAAAAPLGLSALELNAGLRAVHRSFDYHDTPRQLFPNRTGLPNLPAYTLPLGPALFIDGTIYPLAFGSKGAGAMFGLTAGGELNVATKSVYGAAEQTLTTRAWQYYAGLKGRIPFAAHELGLVAAFGQHVFNLLGDQNNPQVPDVAYTFVRLSAEARFRFDEFTIGVHGGTRLVSNTGALERDWFPGRVKTQALEAGISAGYSLSPALDLTCGFDLTRYAFNFNPQPAGANPYSVTLPNVVAGGAVDQYTSGWLGVRYSLRPD